MKINKAEFIKSAVKPEQYPQLPYPEFAFAGRSNVGKSSLINMVTGNSRLVKVGSKPGVTKTINFFSINDTVCIADLPGYGYARVPMELKKQFYPMIKLYFSNRDRLKLVFLLIDIRRVPGDFEKEMISLVTGNNIPVAIIATKCDKLSKNQRAQNTKKILQSLDISQESLFYSSVKSGEGKKDIAKLISEYSR